MEAGYGDRAFSRFQFGDGYLHVFGRGERPGLDLDIVSQRVSPGCGAAKTGIRGESAWSCCR